MLFCYHMTTQYSMFYLECDVLFSQNLAFCVKCNFCLSNHIVKKRYVAILEMEGIQYYVQYYYVHTLHSIHQG